MSTNTEETNRLLLARIEQVKRERDEFRDKLATQRLKAEKGKAEIARLRNTIGRAGEALADAGGAQTGDLERGIRELALGRDVLRGIGKRMFIEQMALAQEAYRIDEGRAQKHVHAADQIRALLDEGDGV